MERDNHEQSDLIDLGTASEVTEGVGGPLDDQGIGKLFAGLSND